MFQVTKVDYTYVAGLPDEKGRLQILNIHTSMMRKNKKMANDVDLVELSQLSKNFSGAEIEGLVRSATSTALNRHVKVGQILHLGIGYNMHVTTNLYLMQLRQMPFFIKQNS